MSTPQVKEPDTRLPDWIRRDDAGRLLADGVSLESIAGEFGTPAFVYSRSAIEQTFGGFVDALAGRHSLLCYAVKANANLAVIDVFRRLGAGFDIVSGGELERVLATGAAADRIVFSGVGKTVAEIRRALEVGVRCFNVESEAELERIDGIATATGRRAPISLRVNPDVDASTHPYISTGLRRNKFGIAHDRALDVYRRAATLPGLRIVGIDCHIGSQITELSPFLAALDKLLELVDQLSAAGITLEHLDLGGGLGIRYEDEQPPTPRQLIDALFERLEQWRPGAVPEVMFEFGRALIGNAGLLLTRVEYLKNNGEHHFAIVDAAMTELLRPALYQSWHGVVPVTTRPAPPPTQAYDVVGPVCESGDWLARGRELAIAPGDLLAILSAGAYAAQMSSNYNSRPRVPELMIADGRTHVVRARETVAGLFASERTLDGAAG